MQYRRDIDGLRAIAVLSVLFFHARFSWFQGGFVGVDVFFVISGYLITSIIQSDIEAGQFSLTAFYERRIRRILPALFLTILLTWAVAFFLYMPPEFKSYSASVAATATFVSNILFWRQAGYFAGASDVKPLLNVWSLAVEEQFYLLFPLAMVLLWRFRRPVPTVAIGCVLLGSFGLSMWGTSRVPGATFYLAPTRAWELMLGAMVALRCFPVAKNRIVAECAAIAGLCGILWAVLVFSSKTHFPGAGALIPCAGTALLIWSDATGKTGVGSLLRAKPLVFVGLISYPLYLFHWPLFAFARYYWISSLPAHVTVGVLIVATAGAAICRRYIEQPFRTRNISISRRGLFAGAAAMSFAFLVAGLVGYTKNGFPGRFPNYSHLEYRDRLAEYNDRSCFLQWDESLTGWKGDECFLSRRGRPITLLWGDSFSAHLVPGIKANTSLIDTDILQFSVASCAPILDIESAWRGGCQAAAQKALAIAKRYSVSRVILAVHWDLESKYYSHFFASIRNTIATLRSRGVEVMVVGQSPSFTFWDSLDIKYRLQASHRSASNFYRFLSFNDDFIATVKTELAGTPVIDPMKILCQPQACDILTNGEPMYIDGSHLSVIGSTILIRAIAPDLNADTGYLAHLIGR